MTDALALLRELRCRGAIVHASGDRVAIDAPEGVVTSDVQKAIRTGKSELLARLAEEDFVLGMSLQEFERAGCPIEARVP